MSVMQFPMGLVDADFDYIAVDTTSSTTADVFTYKSGGASGTVVKTITLTYSDASTKLVLISVAIV